MPGSDRLLMPQIDMKKKELNAPLPYGRALKPFFLRGFRNHHYYVYNITLLVSSEQLSFYRRDLPYLTTQPSKEKCFFLN